MADAQRSGGGAWTAQRFASLLVVFVPELIAALGLGSLDGPRDGGTPGLTNATAGGYLRATLLRMYGDATRNEAGLWWPRDVVPYPEWRCVAASGADAASARRAAHAVARRFEERYHASLRPIYLMLYLENVLPMAVPSGGLSKAGLGPHAIAARLGAMLDFVELCLAAPVPSASPVRGHAKDEL